jgi:sec-independent protein translocase protein TatA
MFEIGIEKILLIMVVVLLLFGAKRIPEIGHSLGKGIREFRKSMSEISRDVARETNFGPLDSPSLPSSPAYPPHDRSSAASAPSVPDRAEPKRLL